MIEKKVIRRSLTELDAPSELTYWLQQPASERIAAIEYLRRTYYGESARLQELLELLNSHHVEYLIVGAYALALHGAPRMTGDLDIFIHPTAENAERLLNALHEFGFGSLGLNLEDFLRPERVVQLGVPPVRIDLLTSLTGVTWEEADEGKIKAEYGGLPVFFLGRDELVRHKKATGRKRDAADLEALGES